AEDGIRDATVTGVQTCALPISADAFARGSERPGAHPFLKILAANMAQHAGEVETARILWITTFESTHDRQIKYNALAHLRALKEIGRASCRERVEISEVAGASK